MLSVVVWLHIIVWIGLCLRSVPGVRVLASAVDSRPHVGVFLDVFNKF